MKRRDDLWVISREIVGVFLGGYARAVTTFGPQAQNAVWRDQNWNDLRQKATQRTSGYAGFTWITHEDSAMPWRFMRARVAFIEDFTGNMRCFENFGSANASGQKIRWQPLDDFTGNKGCFLDGGARALGNHWRAGRSALSRERRERAGGGEKIF